MNTSVLTGKSRSSTATAPVLGDESAIVELLQELMQNNPNSEVALQLSRALEGEREAERTETEFPWILFSLSDTAYAINSKYVLSIEILGEITPIVDAPHFIPGITRSRGEMIDILDMRALFGSGNYRSAKSENPDAVYMMVVTEVGSTKRGLIVDEIISVEYISKFDTAIVSPDGTVSSAYVEKVAHREKTDETVLILNPNALISL